MSRGAPQRAQPPVGSKSLHPPRRGQSVQTGGLDCITNTTGLRKMIASPAGMLNAKTDVDCEQRVQSVASGRMAGGMCDTD